MIKVKGIAITEAMLEWCLENFGNEYEDAFNYYVCFNQGFDWRCKRWAFSDFEFYFKNEEDATLFRLTWL